MKRILLICLSVYNICIFSQSPVPLNAKLEKIATGFKFVEGPVWHDNLGLLFSDIEGNTIYNWSPADNTVKPYLQPSDSSNGLSMDAQGRLILTQMRLRRISRLETDGKITPLVNEFRGKKFNCPNDLAVKSDGSIFFTDPDFNIPFPYDKQLPFKGVYRLSPSGSVTLLDSTFDKPNGICFSPDEKKLYVNESPKGSVYVWDVDDKNNLSNKKLFYQIVVGGYSDGMKTDPAGNLYCTGPEGVYIISPEGILLDKILITEAARNCNWGDADRKTIYITAGTSIYRIRLAGADTPADAPAIESSLEVFNIESGKREVLFTAKEHFEAPNWSRDDKKLYYNKGGKIYTISVAGGKPELLNTGFATQCNNDHGLSPDGKQFVVSHSSEDGRSRIYILPATGGEPVLVTPNAPSYWHGWSPDGKTLAYCSERNGEFDIYTIPVSGGDELRLTNAPGLDDGPDYSADGKYIYFNSVRSGQMKIWRMKADGTEQVQVTPDDEYGDWFAHPSPDGKWLVFLSYDKSVEGHPANKDVALRIMSVDGGEIKILTKLFGGQGTMNVPSWSPDSKRFAFVSYRLINK